MSWNPGTMALQVFISSADVTTLNSAGKVLWLALQISGNVHHVAFNNWAPATDILLNVGSLNTQLSYYTTTTIATGNYIDLVAANISDDTTGGYIWNGSTITAGGSSGSGPFTYRIHNTTATAANLGLLSFYYPDIFTTYVSASCASHILAGNYIDFAQSLWFNAWFANDVPPANIGTFYGSYPEQPQTLYDELNLYDYAEAYNYSIANGFSAYQEDAARRIGARTLPHLYRDPIITQPKFQFSFSLSGKFGLRSVGTYLLSVVPKEVHVSVKEGVGANQFIATFTGPDPTKHIVALAGQWASSSLKINQRDVRQEHTTSVKILKVTPVHSEEVAVWNSLLRLTAAATGSSSSSSAPVVHHPK